MSGRQHTPLTRASTASRGKKVICCIVAFEAVVIYFAEWPRLIATKLVVILK